MTDSGCINKAMYNRKTVLIALRTSITAVEQMRTSFSWKQGQPTMERIIANGRPGIHAMPLLGDRRPCRRCAITTNGLQTKTKVGQEVSLEQPMQAAADHCIPSSELAQ